MGIKAKALVLSITLMVLSGFDLNNASVPVREILSGGPPKDGIPALTDPKVVQVSQASFLKDSDRVIGVEIEGQARAYPIRILNWHEVVNDSLAGKYFAVTYCPLCGTGMVFNAGSAGKRVTFGVSGKLYNSDVLLYDRKTESLWSQLMMEAIAGPQVGEKLHLLPASHTIWKDWKKRYPATTVLSIDTGFSRDYTRNPYEGYGQSKKLFFPISNEDSRFHPKEWVVGIVLNGKARAYPFSEFKKLGSNESVITDSIDDIRLKIHFDTSNRTAKITDSDDAEIPSVQAFWFAWATFYPTTTVFRATNTEITLND